MLQLLVNKCAHLIKHVKTYYMKKGVALLSIVIFLLGCSKKDEGETKPATDVTINTLMGSSGKRWPLSSVKLTYYNTGGGVDSIAILEPNANNYQHNTLYFSDNNGVNGLNLVFDTEDILTKVVPAFGSWSFNQSTQKITFTCIANQFFPCNGTDGEWQIVTHYINHAYRIEKLVLERTIIPAGGGKVKQEINLSIS